MPRSEPEPRTRRERLAAIVAEYTEEIHQPRAERQLAGVEPVWRYAAVTSEGSPESAYASNGNVIVAESTAGLAELLRQECGEGWVAHGRVWDLDGSWHLWGNLEIAYSVRVGEECARPIGMVRVADREDGTTCSTICSTPRRSPRRSAAMAVRRCSPSSRSTTTAAPTG